MWLLPLPSLFTAWQQLWPRHLDGVSISPALLCWFLLLGNAVSTTDAVLIRGNADWCWLCLALLMMLPSPPPSHTMGFCKLTLFSVIVLVILVDSPVPFNPIQLSSLSLPSCPVVVLAVICIPAIFNVVNFL